MIARAPDSAPFSPDPADINAPARTRTINTETPPRTPADLHAWLRAVADVDIPRVPILPGSTAPFDYLVHTFFEGRAGVKGSTDRGTKGSSQNKDTPTPHASPSNLDPTIPRSLDPSSRNPIFKDPVLWANRGGGKTFLGAVATMLDLVFKPGVQVRILGGSLEQSGRMHAHLRRLFASPHLESLLDGRITDKRLRLVNNSCVEILAQSETAVRGTRVQKLRCDEVELFDREVWNAAQLTTRSMRLMGPWGRWVRGSIEALSTMHRPYGLMWEIVGQTGSPLIDADPLTPATAATPARAPKRRLFRWGVVDVLAACGPEHRCDGCALWEECRGRAKGLGEGIKGTRDHGIELHQPRVLPRSLDPMIPGSQSPTPARGHIAVADALAMKSRVDAETWASEMLCLRPRRSHTVFPEFDPAIHVIDGPDTPIANRRHIQGAVVCGMDFGLRAPTVILWGIATPDGALRIVDERIVAGLLLREHIAAMTAGDGLPGSKGWPAPLWVGADPAGHAREDQSGRSNIDDLRAAGLTVRARPFEVHPGINLVRARLAPPSPADGSLPRLQVHRRCAGLIEALQRYHYDETRPESVHPVKDGHDHAADALRYLIVALDRPYTARTSNYLG